jgi:BASS family bile acid:Na+ symporter
VSVDPLKKLLNAFSVLGRHGTFIMPIGVILGLLFPALTQAARPLAEPLVMLMLAVSIYRLDPAAVVDRLRNPLVIGSGIGWVLLVVPFVVVAVGLAAGLPPGLLAVVAAWSACPPLVSTPGLALILGLDGAAALLIMVGATFLFTITLPLVLLFLLGDGLGLDPSSLSLRLLVMVTLCCLAGQGFRWLIRGARVEPAAAADGALVVLMLLFAVTIMGGLHDALEHHPARIPLFLAVAVIASIGTQIFTAAAFWRLAGATGGSIALASGGRNIALLLPVASGSFADDLWLYIAVVQIPNYFLPAISKPIYRMYGAAPRRAALEDSDE